MWYLRFLSSAYLLPNKNYYCCVRLHNDWLQHLHSNVSNLLTALMLLIEKRVGTKEWSFHSVFVFKSWKCHDSVRGVLNYTSNQPQHFTCFQPLALVSRFTLISTNIYVPLFQHLIVKILMLSWSCVAVCTIVSFIVCTFFPCISCFGLRFLFFAVLVICIIFCNKNLYLHPLPLQIPDRESKNLCGMFEFFVYISWGVTLTESNENNVKLCFSWPCLLLCNFHVVISWLLAEHCTAPVQKWHTYCIWFKKCAHI